METFEFTFKIKLNEPNIKPEVYLEKLMEAGSDDAMVGIGQKGHIALNFSREASSSQEALTSALANVKEAIPESKLIEACPDFVGLTDIADLFGFTRQNMRKMMLKSRASFPSPIHE